MPFSLYQIKPNKKNALFLPLYFLLNYFREDFWKWNPIPTLPVNLSGEEPGILAGKYDLKSFRLKPKLSQNFLKLLRWSFSF